ncbi:MAG: MFS transporter [Actinomycetota bacterium]
MAEPHTTEPAAGRGEEGAAPEPPVAMEPAAWREVFRGKRGRLTAGLLILEALVAIQALVVATILPDIRRDLGMVQLYGLTFTAAGLALMAAIPIFGRAVDRFGARRLLAPILLLFAGGLIVCATAVGMPMVLAGQFLAGAGGGGLYALSLGTIAKTYPDNQRPRVMALLATMWILPGLLGPPVGALIASTIGWRAAFLAPIPVLLVGWALMAPALDLVPTPEAGSEARPLAVRWPLQLMLGAGLFFTALTFVQPWALAMAGAGLLIGWPALGRIVPAGTIRAGPGLPAAAMAAVLRSVGFLAFEGFLTLMLTDIRDLSLVEASNAVTAATLTWAAGSLWQSGRADRIPLGRLVVVGGLLSLVGGGFVAAALIQTVPVVSAFAGWALVGLGMGIAFPTIPLAAMRVSSAGEESSELASVLLLDVIGVATGAGLGGGAIAVSNAIGAPLASGIAWSFAIGAVAFLALVLWAGPRILSGPGHAARA